LQLAVLLVVQVMGIKLQATKMALMGFVEAVVAALQPPAFPVALVVVKAKQRLIIFQQDLAQQKLLP
jgi:hypothetical protein